MRQWISLLEANDDLTAEPFEAVDPISHKPNINFRIIQNGEVVSVVAGRFAKTPEEALAVYQRPRVDHWAVATPREPKPPPPPRPSKPTKFEVVDPESIESVDSDDEFYYHVTTRPMQVLRDGLRPNRRPSMNAGFYRDYSAGKVFFCERSGVSFWLWRIGDHLEAQYEHPPKLSVVRFPKSLVADPQEDRPGTQDSHAGSYFVTHAIRPR